MRFAATTMPRPSVRTGTTCASDPATSWKALGYAGWPGDPRDEKTSVSRNRRIRLRWATASVLWTISSGRWIPGSTVRSTRIEPRPTPASANQEVRSGSRAAYPLGTRPRGRTAKPTR